MMTKTCPATSLKSIQINTTCPATSLKSIQINKTCPVTSLKSIQINETCPVTSLNTIQTNETCPVTSLNTIQTNKTCPVTSHRLQNNGLPWKITLLNESLRKAKDADTILSEVKYSYCDEKWYWKKEIQQYIITSLDILKYQMRQVILSVFWTF